MTYDIRRDIHKLYLAQPIYRKTSDWIAYEGAEVGAYVNVDYTDLGFTKTPLVFTSLHGNSHIWLTAGATSIYNATPTGFTVYIKGLPREALIEHNAVLHYELVPQYD